ncbi:MAG: glycosyltransferase family 2 protein [Thermomicrobiales bacterium]|jgi:glycosyltransferase involved in cell wall biosynthesis|nr:glycosyltransferase family 2 protein [Thermomicrobiales bacterium]
MGDTVMSAPAQTAPVADAALEPISTPYQLSVVMPAYNEAASLERVLWQVMEQLPDAEIIVVDDASTDDTPAIAARCGARVVRQPYNKGNGAAVKAGIRAAHGDVVLLLDADGQHDPDDLARVLEPIGPYDLVVAARSRESNASWARGVGNAALNQLATYLTGMDIPDLTSGFRAMKRDQIMEFIHLLPNRYSYPTTSTLAFIKAGYSVKFVPIEARKRVAGKSAQKLLANGVVFGTIILRMVTLYSPLKIFAPISLVLFLLGAGYAIFTIITQVHITNSQVLLVLTALLIFLMGLISEQIAAYRFERRE